ncbi:hypothetical protein E3N88_02886 [Mikania micrantha]|uniref:Uncharacterized protein n=1 Tax=Mikania micrantha TaxID=192012 RepID=A0A5N6Q7S4_9ASTR|nr:hypothetical protein E3N88_02886 [Mikania micrantha]
MNWASWAQPKPIAVRDGHTIGLSRYAKPERENLNSPKNVAVRDDRSSYTTAHPISTLSDLQAPLKPFPSHRRPLEEFEALKNPQEHSTFLFIASKSISVTIRIPAELFEFYFSDSKLRKVTDGAYARIHTRKP